jgi:glycerol-3-phosphate acyltransferase PlsY
VIFLDSLIIATLLIFIIAFLLGSIPFGFLVSKLMYQTDIRSKGSGNIGTTNGIRVLGFKGGALIFILDCGKGLLAGVISVVACNLLWPETATIPILQALSSEEPGILDANALRAIACVGVVLGHVFTPWLGFRGGKGIAAGLGSMFFVIGPVATLMVAAIFAAVVLIFRYVSLGSIIAAIACPIFSLWFLSGWWLAIFLCTLLTIIFRGPHRVNLKRLLSHSENRVGASKQQQIVRNEIANNEQQEG